DKNENFNSKLTPRLAAVVKVAENNNISLSYQTAYRFPTTQGQYIRLEVGQNQYILGGLPWIVEYMNLKQNPAVLIENGTITNKPYQYKTFKPESSRTFELGYKSLIQNKVLVDVYGYTSSFKDFLARQLLYQPGTGYIFSIVTNSESKIKIQGYGASLTYRLPLNFAASANFFSDKISDVPQNLAVSFNTPKYRFNASFSNSGLGKGERWGFGVQFRWQDAFFYESDFVQGTVPAFSTLDAQVSYKVLQNKSVVRIGATNLLNHYYKNAFGNPEIGGLYYVSLGYNLFK
ncbi:MAG: TonB-dependent receptor, partial [Flavisolibacter sp.]|nr:TonB-dependent receptor [Flavisolibacter sp.]